MSRVYETWIELTGGPLDGQRSSVPEDWVDAWGSPRDYLQFSDFDSVSVPPIVSGDPASIVARVVTYRRVDKRGPSGNRWCEWHHEP